MKTTVFEQCNGLNRRKCLGIIIFMSIAVLVLMVQLTDEGSKIQALRLLSSTKNPQTLRQTIYTTRSVPPIKPEAASLKEKPDDAGEKQNAKEPSLQKTSVSKSISSTESQSIKTENKESTVRSDKNVTKDDKTNSANFVHNISPSDFRDETNFEPYCAMQSNAHKYLIWPDTPTDLTDWTYKRIRKCPKYVIPSNLANTKRVKYTLTCDKNRPRLEPSFTTKSDDVQRVALNDTCLAKFTNSCCNDSRGVPNIVHYVWYFKNEMKFYMFLSMLSIIRYVRPCLILFHGEFLPSGQYWDYIIRLYPNILHIHRARPMHIFGKKISHHEHSGDIMRMDALMELGGMYFDTDVIVLRDIESLRQYDMTLCFQASGYMLNAFIMSKKNATFLTLWMDGYRKDYRNDSYVYNSMWYNNDLAKNRSDLIHIEKGTLCAPAKLIGTPINSTMIYDWSKLYGYHLYARTIHFPWNVDWIKHFNATVGSMVRQVVYGNKELCE